jgi:SAM-dependent methyltransferase
MPSMTTSAITTSRPAAAATALEFRSTTAALARDGLQATLDGWLARRETPPRVLDAGCGHQMYLHIRDAASVVGIDIDPAQLDGNATIDEKILGDVQTYPLPAASFDLVICYEVMEHLERPDLALENLIQAVCPGGLLVLGGPNLFSLKGLVTRFTPHWVHRLYYRMGGSGLEPFRVYMRQAATPGKLAEWAHGRGLAAQYASQFESPLQRRARERIRLTGSGWRALRGIGRAVTGGRVDLAATDFMFVLAKPA